MIKRILKITFAILAITALVGSISSCGTTKYGKSGHGCPNRM